MDSSQQPPLESGSGTQVFGEASRPGPAEATIVDEWASAPQQPVVPTSRRDRRMRWAAAMAVVLCVVLVSAAAAFVIAGADNSKSTTVAFAPKTSMIFATVRTDLPGSQHQQLADFMSHFPGFKDRAAFDMKIREFVNEMSSKISPDLAYGTAVEPWLGNELSVAVTRYAPYAALNSYAMPSVDPATGNVVMPDPSSIDTGVDAVLIVTVKDRAAGEKFLDEQRTKSKLEFSSQSYAGSTIWTSTTANGSYALTDKVLLVGTASAVKAALDAPKAGSIDETANYKAASKALSGDRIGSLYVDMQAYMKAATDMSGISLPSTADMTCASDLLTKQVPAWVAGDARIDSGKLIFDSVSPAVAGAASPSNHTSLLAPALPRTTIAAVEVHSISSMLDTVTKMYSDPKACASLQQVGTQLKQALNAVGGLKWAGDGVLAITSDGKNVGGGLVVQATDAKAAQGAAETVFNLASVAAGSGGQSREEQYAGTTINVIHLASAGNVDLAIAQRDRLVILGYGDAFVKAVLDTKSGSSLADQARYKNVIAAAGSENAMQMYVDLPATIALATSTMPSADMQRYNTDIKPFIEQLDAVGSASITGNPNIGRIVITTK